METYNAALNAGVPVQTPQGRIVSLGKIREKPVRSTVVGQVASGHFHAIVGSITVIGRFDSDQPICVY